MIEIIAEIGINHNGDINIAKKLIEEAKLAGADCVKFQTFSLKNLLDNILQNRFPDERYLIIQSLRDVKKMSTFI